MLTLVVFNGERIAVEQFLGKEGIGAIITYDDPNILEVDILLKSNAVQQRSDYFVCLFILWY
jgi:hypothetical protein